MTFSIYWTKKAEETFDNIVNYLEEKWGSQTAEKFVKRTQKTLSTISKQPYIFKSSDLGQDIRMCIITKQSSLFYEIHGTEIHLLFFWDNRQKPLF